jgi:hypothetical protein
VGLYLELVDFDRMFAQSSRPPIIINRFNTSTKEGKEELNQLLYMRYEGDTLDVVPSCLCGKYTGEFNKEIICDVCHASPKSITERPLESSLWMEPPEGVVAFVNPTAWIMFSKALYDNGQRMLEWMCSPTFVFAGEPKHRMRRLMDIYAANGFQRGLNYFITNFDAIFSKLVEFKLIYNAKKEAAAVFIEFVMMYRHALFPKRLPLPSRLSFITEDTVTGRYADTSMTTALDAALTISDIAHSVIPLTLKVKEARTVKTIMLLATFYEGMIGKTLGKKEGWLRKHVYGSRLHLSFRGVITSLSNNHDYDECHLPWSMAAMLFQTHLVSKLIKRGETPDTATEFIFRNTLQYHPLLDALFQELIAEGFGDKPRPDAIGGIPVIIQRNPSLQRGSAQCLRLTKIKTNPDINSISLSVLILRGFNADKRLSLAQ